MLLRKILKICALLGVCLMTLAIGLLVHAGGMLLPRYRSFARAEVQRAWARAMCRVLGLRIDLRDASSCLSSERGCFVVSNHISYLDIIVLAATIPAAFLSKQEVRSWPLLGWLATLAGTVYVDREAKRSALGAMEQIEERLAHGVHVIVFPEGTTSDGCQVLPFKSTFFDLPSRLMVPVLPVAVRYLGIDERLLPAGECSPLAWFGDTPLGPSVWQVLDMRSIDASVTCVKPLEATSGADRKELARTAQAAVGSAYWTTLDT